MRPWYVPQAIDYLEEIFKNRDNLSVFEFGGGGSTLYWLSLGCSVITVEDSPKYAVQILGNLMDEKTRSRLTLILTARPYHLEYTRFLSSESFDLVIVDGRDRSLCMSEIRKSSISLPKVFILDNSDRKHYQCEFKEFHNYYNFQHFSHKNGWTTSVGIRKEFGVSEPEIETNLE